MLTDGFGRTHDYLRISLADKCNLRCSYCKPYGLPIGYFANSIRVNPVEIEKICPEFVRLGIQKIRLTGGEPLLRKEIRTIIGKVSKFLKVFSTPPEKLFL